MTNFSRTVLKQINNYDIQMNSINANYNCFQTK